MSKGDSPTIREIILECLSDGQTKPTTDIQAYVHQRLVCKASSVSKVISQLKSGGEIKKKGRGNYSLPNASPTVPVAVQDAPAGAENSREASDNIETINKMLNVYDLLLDDIVATLSSELAEKETIEKKIDLIKSLRWVAATIDQLMKRWYLVHRGYDTNTRQAVEDAKQKTVDREKQETENAPPEKQLKVVREYDESMREILAKMPKPVQEETTV